MANAASMHDLSSTTPPLPNLAGKTLLERLRIVLSYKPTIIFHVDDFVKGFRFKDHPNAIASTLSYMAKKGLVIKPEGRGSYQWAGQTTIEEKRSMLEAHLAESPPRVLTGPGWKPTELAITAVDRGDAHLMYESIRERITLHKELFTKADLRFLDKQMRLLGWESAEKEQ